METQEKTPVEQKKAPPEKKEPAYGEYEPLEKMPEKKGLFARLWAWLKGLFT